MPYSCTQRYCVICMSVGVRVCVPLFVLRLWDVVSGEKDQCNSVTRKWAKDKAEWLKREEH